MVAGPAIPHALPAPLDEKSYFRGRLAVIREVERGAGWQNDPDWSPKDKAATRKGFVRVPMLVSEEPGAVARFAFEGTAVGIFVAAGPDAGTLEFSIDDGPFRSQSLSTNWSATLPIPWAYVLDADLPPGKHILAMRAAKGAIRIAYMLVN
ncbi:Putative O-antigen related protein (fragment) [Candidatus Sulfopaludibacter sp. SbA3]